MTILVGITGGIGSGKSTFSGEVIKRGGKLLDSDKEVDVLYKNPKLMPGIFYNMFTANNEKVVKFLSNKSNFIDDVHIIMKMPKMIFIKELIQKCQKKLILYTL